MADYIPGSDQQFQAWLDNFVAYVNDNQAQLGVDLPDVTALQNVKTQFDGDLTAHVQTRAAARAVTATKETSRESAEQQVRRLVRRLQASPAVTVAQKQSMNLALGAPPTPAPAPATAPVVRVDLSQRLRHVLRISDELTPGSRKKPRGVVAAEVWRKLGGAAPLGPDECELVASALGWSHLLDYAESHGGKTVHYLVRWVNRRGDAGPWGETVSATVAA